MAESGPEFGPELEEATVSLGAFMDPWWPRPSLTLSLRRSARPIGIKRVPLLSVMLHDGDLARGASDCFLVAGRGKNRESVFQRRPSQGPRQSVADKRWLCFCFTGESSSPALPKTGMPCSEAELATQALLQTLVQTESGVCRDDHAGACRSIGYASTYQCDQCGEPSA